MVYGSDPGPVHGLVNGLNHGSVLGSDLTLDLDPGSDLAFSIVFCSDPLPAVSSPRLSVQDTSLGSGIRNSGLRGQSFGF